MGDADKDCDVGHFVFAASSQRNQMHPLNSSVVMSHGHGWSSRISKRPAVSMAQTNLELFDGADVNHHFQDMAMLQHSLDVLQNEKGPPKQHMRYMECVQTHNCYSMCVPPSFRKLPTHLPK